MGYDRGDSFPFDFLNQMDFHLVQNQKENCHHDHIPFNSKGNGIRVLSVKEQAYSHRGTRHHGGTGEGLPKTLHSDIAVMIRGVVRGVRRAREGF